MAMKTLQETARALGAPGKGILAADESHATPLATWRGDPMRVYDGQRSVG